MSSPLTGDAAVAWAASAKLQKVGRRPRLGSYVADAWRRRSFALTLAQFSLEASTSKSRLGVAWLVIVPALQITIYGLIFGFILGSARPANFMPFLITGIVLFQFLAGSFSDGAKSITSNASLVRSLNFPRMLLPVSAVISQVFKFVPLMLIMMITLLFLGEPIRVQWLLMLPILLLALLFSAGTAMIAARLTVHLSDLNQLIPFLTRVAFYASGVFFSVDKVFASFPELGVIAKLNPIHAYLALARGVLVRGYEVTAFDWIVGGAWAAVALIAGFFYFWSAEERYGRSA